MKTTLTLTAMTALALTACQSKHPSALQVIETAKDTNNRLTAVTAPQWQKAAANSEGAEVKLLPEQKFQTIVGFGGAITESVGYTLSRVPEALQSEALKAYFDPQSGIGYTVIRTHMNSSDFSLENWSCDDVAGDVELKNFNLDRTNKYITPYILTAQKIAGKPLTTYISPWSPPAWMKTNKDMNHGGKLLPEYRQAWADFYVKFINGLEQQGIPIWGLTVQNEPAAVQVWDSCIYSAEEEGAFVRDYLGPTLEKNGLADKKLMIWDHNKDILYERVAPILKDPAAAKYVWGVGIHWYGGEHPEQLDQVSKEFPDKQIFFTEGCWEGGVKLGQWDRGQRYAHHMIVDLNHNVTGWTDWNIILDETGGPNHVGNFTDAPIIIDTKAAKIHYQTSFYYIGHISKFIKPGAVRIGFENTAKDLEVTAFQNPDSSYAVVAHNNTDNAIKFALSIGNYSANAECPARGIQTYVFKN